MVRVVRKTVLLAKSEVNYGVDPTPTAADNAIAIINANIKETFEANQREVQLSSISKKTSIGGMRYAEITFQTELMGSGTAGTAPKLGALFKACAMTETASAGSSVTYTPATSPISSCTLYLYKDGVLHKVTGALGTCKLTAQAGKLCMLDFSMKGVYNAPSAAANPAPTFESTIDTPPTVVSAGFVYGAVASLVVESFMLDIANTVALRPSIQEAYAVKGFHVTDRRPNCEFNPEAEALTTVNYRSDIMSTQRALQMVIGSAAGNKCTIDIPVFNPVDVEYGDREQTLIETVKGECAANTGTGDDEYSLKFE